MLVTGMHQTEFWSSTFRHNTLRTQHKEREYEDSWKQTRNVEFAVRQSAFALPMNGKAVFPFKSLKKPEDLYTLPSELNSPKKKSTAVFNPERAIAAYNKTSDNKIWQTRD